MFYICMPYHIYDMNQSVKEEKVKTYPKVLTKIKGNVYKVNIPKQKVLNLKGSYNKGFKYYNRYIFKHSKIKSTKFLTILRVKNETQLKVYFENPKKMIETFNKLGYKKISNGVIYLEKKHKLGDLYYFLKGVLNGKIPASCG